MASTSDAGPRAALRLIRSRRFGPYFAGNALSAMGLWFHNLAAALLIFRLTGSEFLLGVLTVTQFAPTLFLVSVAGSAADRFDRQKVVVTAQVTAAVLGAGLALLAWVDAAPVPVVLVISLALGVCSAFSAPAAAALIAALVEPRDLASAVGLNSMTYNIARAAGPALAALVVSTLGIPAAFAVNAGSYLALAIGVLVVSPPRVQARKAGASTRLRDTIALIRREPRLGAYLLVVMVVGFASDPINTLAPAFAHAFDRPDTFAGPIIGAFGAGAVLAAVLLAGRVAERRVLGMTMILLGAGIAAFSLVPSEEIGLLILVAAGFGYLSSNAGTTSRLQLEVDEAQRGRIMALWGVAFLGLRPVASLLDGALASAFGVRAAGVVLALPALAAGVVLLLGLRPHRLARRPAVADPGARVG